MKEFKTRIEEISKKRNWKFAELPNDILRLDISLVLADKKVRFQYVFISFKKGKDKQKDRYYMNSRIGKYNERLLLPMVKKTGSILSYSSLGVINDKDKEGNPIETFIIQAVPHTIVSDELLLEIIFEVGNYADYMEEIYYGEDQM